MNYDKAVIVSGDGYLHRLVHYLALKDELEKFIVSDRENYSALLKKFASKLTFLNELRKKLAYNKKSTQ
jgi:uncharacterized LabA/DUF88 family protein